MSLKIRIDAVDLATTKVANEARLLFIWGYINVGTNDKVGIRGGGCSVLTVLLTWLSEKL